jgi:hypothetical protein
MPSRRAVAGETLEHGHGRRRRPVADPGVRFGPAVASLHVTSPLAPDAKRFDDWRHGITGIKAARDGFADAAGPGSMIAAADFIMTPDMRRFRDAVKQTGRFRLHDGVYVSVKLPIVANVSRPRRRDRCRTSRI